MVSQFSRRSFLCGAAAFSGLPTIGMSELAVGKPAPLTLHRGINTFPWFALTREYQAPRTDYAWPPFDPDRPVPTPLDLVRLREIGLDFIRIPVDPGPFLAAKPYQKHLLMGQLLQAVEEALNADLSVVVNIQANSATHYWTPKRMFASLHAPAFPAYEALAAEIAKALSARSVTRIALEPVNEPPQACGSPLWSDAQISLLKRIRASAPALTVIATGSCGSMIAGLEALDPKPLFSFEPLLFTFHFYEPYLFTHQGASWMSEPMYHALNAVPWPASAGSLDKTLAAVRRQMAKDDKTPEAKKIAIYAHTKKELKVYFDANPSRPFIDSYLSKVRDWGKRHAIAPGRILLGEFGSLRSGNGHPAGGAADQARYIRDVRESAESFGFPWALWDLFTRMGMMDDKTHAFDPAIVKALGLHLPRN